jgi:protein SCO1
MASRLLPLFALFFGCGASSPTLPAPTDIDPGFQVGPFALTERSGKTITDKDLRGSVWVASFVFTRCTGPCPTVSSSVARLQKELKDEPGVKFVTFTVDPIRDDLATLREYANIRGADPERWLFLTGDEKTMHEVIAQQFRVAVVRNLEPDVKPGEEFDHSTRLFLVDKQGVIRGIYSGMPDAKMHNSEAAFAAELDRLKARARELVK